MAYDGKALADKVLSHPEYFPSSFTSWLQRLIGGNPLFTISQAQLPQTELVHVVAASALQNGWLNAGGADSVASYYKDGGQRVHLTGLVKSGTINTPIFTLPASYRPVSQETFVVVSNDLIGRVVVTVAGDVIPVVGSPVWLSLAGISFRA